MKDFFSKCDQMRRKLGIWSHLLKKSLMENLVLCSVRKESFISQSPLKVRYMVLFFLDRSIVLIPGFFVTLF